MTTHPAVREVIAGFERMDLHAARAGRVVMQALAQTAADSPATDLAALNAELGAAVEALLAVMPAYAPPRNVMHRVLALTERALEGEGTVADVRAALMKEAAGYSTWHQTAQAKIIEHATALIPAGGTVFTFTLSETISLVLVGAKRSGRNFRVLVTESGPNNDGLETVRRLSEAGIPVAVGPDACLGELVPQAGVILVGAEAILADGSAICKVGTYVAGLVAAAHGVPLYVVVDTMKLDASSRVGGSDWRAGLPAGAILRPPLRPGVRVVGSLFDRTPPHLITGIVTERGVLHPAACEVLFRVLPLSHTLTTRLAALRFEREVEHAQ
jgi:translation initiation factor 2B subunit (eIF-2B alpha/beta/delta family)